MFATDFGLALKTPPGTEPITQAEAKAHLRITHANDDTYIDTLIVAARKMFEARARRQLVTATFNLYFDRFPRIIYLPRPPALTVESIKYFDDVGVEQTLASTEYQLDITRAVGRILNETTNTATSTDWPTTEIGRTQAVNVEYTCGYGAAAAVPEDIKQALLMALEHWYVFRAPVVAGVTVAKVPNTVDAIIQRYKVARF